MLRRMKTLLKRQGKIIEEMQEIRNNCPHVNVEKTPMSDTGNYDPSCDRYWYACVCNDCGKMYTEDQ